MSKISDHIKADHKQVYDKYRQIWALGAFDEEVPKKDKQALVVDLVKLMTVHANAEEALLYPILHHMPAHGKEAAQKAVAEHQDVELMLYQIERTDVNAPEFVNLIKRAVGTFKKHADDEETRLLPAIDAFIEERAGNQMAKTIEEYIYTKQHASTMPHPAINRPGEGQKVAEDLLKTAEHEARFASAESAHLMAAVSGTTTTAKK